MPMPEWLYLGFEPVCAWHLKQLLSAFSSVFSMFLWFSDCATCPSFPLHPAMRSTKTPYKVHLSCLAMGFWKSTTDVWMVKNMIILFLLSLDIYGLCAWNSNSWFKNGHSIYLLYPRGHIIKAGNTNSKANKHQHSHPATATTNR